MDKFAKPTVKSAQIVPNEDLISRKSAIDEAEEWIETYTSGRGGQRERDAIKHVISGIKKLPSAQPEEAIPVSWIESRIERFEAMDNSLSGLTASITRVMLNEWKKEQKGDTK